jgi:lipopolysaccharide biosynthesis protein
MQKLIAFYLPQFHPIKENDDWWGPGFTEWRNVVSSYARYHGHHQPQLPADLGFYDLRLEETRDAQAKLAANYGIFGFCYYHYWFNGRMLLERPFNDVLSSGQPDFPFCLCWANENWTRAWDGLDRQILMRQQYGPEDSQNHIKWLLRAFCDDRYIKINNSPLLLIYRFDQIPNIETMIKSWRRETKRAGLHDLYLCAVTNGFIQKNNEDILRLGFDAIVDFQPNRFDFPPPQGAMSRIIRIARELLPDIIYQKLKSSVSANNIVNYQQMVEGIMKKKWPSHYCKFPCIFPSWDNSARRKSATIIQNDDPKIYGNWLKKSLSNIQAYSDQEQIIFINAWNEWAEGCHLEPDLKNSHNFLKETYDSLVS